MFASLYTGRQPLVQTSRCDSTMPLDVSLCTSNPKMDRRRQITNRISPLEFAEKTGNSGLRDSGPTLIRAVSLLSSRNMLLTDDGCSPKDLTDKNTIIGVGFTSSRHSKRSPRPAKTRPKPTSGSTVAQNTMPYIQRWAGLTRTASNWDGLRRDPELWVEDGECYVHLYAQGASRRGPSFRIPYRALHQKKCGAMLNICHAQLTSAEGVSLQQLSEISNSFNSTKHQSSIVELFIPAPEGGSKQDSFEWHITTRNFFAFVLGKPLVGYHMGQAFVNLQERMQLFRSRKPSDSHQDFLEYAECQGYRDLVEVTDYALANLFYAEHFKLRDVWVDAFAHCVGMNSSLACSPEYQPNSSITKALITRTRLEVDVHLEKVFTALSNFLEEDMSSAYLGLTAATRSQLIRFQRFLRNFYIEKFGYWPPPRGTPFPKALYKSMFYDFQSLYNYLVDLESTAEFSSQKPASGGICVLQNVYNFDKRHGFITLPHPLPLLPKYVSSAEKIESRNAFRHMAITSLHNKACRIQSLSTALALATNRRDENVTHSKIVSRYIQFENMCANQASSHREHGIPAADARKVRWLLIYGAMQYLVSALRAPTEVRDTETPEYPLCCFITEESSWSDKPMVSTPSAAASSNTAQGTNNSFYQSAADTPIQPDCQREDYFGPGSMHRRGSVEFSLPSKTPLSIQNSSIRSLAAISLPRRHSRRNSLSTKLPSHRETVDYGYGDGLNKRAIEPFSIPIAHYECASKSKRPSGPHFLDAADPQTSWLRSMTPPILGQPATSGISHHEHQRTSLLQTLQLDLPDRQTTPDDVDRSESPSSVASQIWSDAASATSSKTSTGGGSTKCRSSMTDQCSLLGGFKSLENISTSAVPTSTSMQPTGFSFGFDDKTLRLSSTTNTPPATVLDDEVVGIALSMPPSPLMTAIIQNPLVSIPGDMLDSATQDPSFVSEPSAFNPVVSSGTNPTIQKKRGSMGVFSSLSALPSGKSTSTPKVKNCLSTPSFIDGVSSSTLKKTPTTRTPCKTPTKEEVSMSTRVRTFLRAYPGF